MHACAAEAGVMPITWFTLHSMRPLGIEARPGEGVACMGSRTGNRQSCEKDKGGLVRFALQVAAFEMLFEGRRGEHAPRRAFDQIRGAKKRSLAPNLLTQPSIEGA